MPLGLIELILFAVVVLGLGFLELRNVTRAQREDAERRASAQDRDPDGGGDDQR